MNLGMDLGSSQVVICGTSGVLLEEPAVIAVDRKSGHMIACGAEAEPMLDRTPPSILAVRPVKNGTIAEYDLTEKMLRHFLRRVCSDRILKPRVAVSITENITEVERRSFIESVFSAGARRVTLVPETVASAIGMGLDVGLPRGQMVVNAGAGTVDAAVLSLRGTAVSNSMKLAGQAVDEAIIRYIHNEHNLVISPTAAQRVKIGIGHVMPYGFDARMTVKGRDAVTGLPRAREVTSIEIGETIQDALLPLTDLISQVLESTPPELSGDILHDGIHLCGGLAQLRGLPEWIERQLGIRCHTASEPRRCVALGAAMALQYASSFSEIYDLSDFSYRLSDSVAE